MAAPDVRITVYDPLVQNVLALDASGDVGPDGIKYEDTPSGCGAGTFNLALHVEDLTAKGYWQIYDTVEVSTGDSVMTAACASGATKIYVDSTAPFNTAAGEDTQQAYFWDGAYLCMRVPVTGIGSDGGGPYITIGTPIAGGGNLAVLPAYGIGTVVGRRRYCGRIMRRIKNNSREPKSVMTTVGFSDIWNRAYDNFVISYSSNVDVGTAIYQALLQNAARWPFFTISPGNFPTTGCIYSGSLQAESIAEFVQDAMTAIITGDYWALRVGHDRIPRLVKLFALSTDTYTYNLTLPQGVAAFEPVNVVIQDDATNLFNSIEVIGNTDPTTKQPTSAIVQDQLSIGYYGQIDGAPVTNLKAQTNAQCEINATSLVAENAAATQQNSMRVYVANDATPVNTPGGFLRGDIVKGVDCVFITRFDGIGGVINALPDSGFQYVATNPQNQIANASLTTQNGWSLSSYCGIDTTNHRLYIAPAASSTGPFVIQQEIPCQPGVPIIYSGLVELDSTYTSGDFRVDVIAYNSAGTLLGTVVSSSPYTAYQNATAFSLTGTTPVGTANLLVRFYFEGTAPSGSPLPAYVYAPSLLIGSPSSLALWSTTGAPAFSTPPNAYGSTGNSLQVTGPVSTAIGFFSQPIDVVPGQTWTLQGTIDARSASGTGTVKIRVTTAGGATVISNTLVCAPGSEVVGSAATAVTFTIPAGVTQIFVNPTIPAAITNYGTGVFFANVQLQLGSIATSYVQNNAAPVEYGLVSSVVTTVMPGGDQWQDVLFSAIEPNYNAVVAEATNAATTALQQNTLTQAGLDQYFVSPNAFGYTISGLVVTAPSFQAVFALGTQPVNVGGNTFTLNANATNFVWLNSNNTWTVNTSPSAVSGAILYAMFTCNGTTVIGSTNRASIGLLQVPASYFLDGVAYTPTFSGIAITETVPSSITSQVSVVFEITNQPTDGSHTKTDCYYRIYGQTYWLLLGTSPPLNGSGAQTPANAPVATGLYTFLFPDATNGIEYEFGAACEAGARRETAVVSLGTITTSAVLLPASAIAGLGTHQNFVCDSDMAFITATGFTAGGGSPNWTYSNFNPGSGSFNFNVKGGDGAGVHYLGYTNITNSTVKVCAYSDVINVISGIEYAITVQGYKNGNTVASFGLVSVADKTANNSLPGTIYASGLMPTQASGPLAITTITWTATLTGTVAFACWATATNGSAAWQQPQVEVGSQYSGYVSGPLTSAAGTLQYLAQPAAVTSTIASTANSSGSYVVNGAITRGAINGDLASGVKPGINLLFNPNVTNGATDGSAGWIYAAHCAPDTVNQRLYIVPPASTAGPWVLQQSGIIVPASQSLTISGLLELDGAYSSGDFRVDVQAFNSSNTLLGEVCSTTALSTYQNATYFTATGVTPASTAYVAFRFFFEGTAPATTYNCYLYAPQLEIGTIATPYQNDQSAESAALTHLPTWQVPADNSALRTGLISGRHLLGGAGSSDTSAIVDGTGALLFNRLNAGVQEHVLNTFGGFSLNANGLLVNTASTGSGGYCLLGTQLLPAVASSGTVFSFEATITNPNGASDSSGLQFYCTNTSGGYGTTVSFIFVVGGGAAGFYLNSPAGTYTAIGTAGTGAPTDTLPHRFRVYCTSNGGTLTMLGYVDNTLYCSATYATSSITGSRSIGFYANYIGMLVDPRTIAVNFGAAPTPISTGLNFQGSLLNVANSPVFSYSSAPTNVTITVPAATYTLTDGVSTVTISGGSPFSFVGLSASQTYYVDIWANLASGQYGCTAPQTARRTSAQILADCLVDGRIAVYANYSFTTPATGTGGGSAGGGGGGGAYCPADYQLVETRERGMIRADEVDIGMHLRGPLDGEPWVRVNDAARAPTTLWRFTIVAPDDTIESFDVNDGHMCMTPAGDWLPVVKMQPGDLLKGAHGSLTVVGTECLGDGHYVGFDVDSHCFSMGSTCAHNAVTP